MLPEQCEPHHARASRISPSRGSESFAKRAAELDAARVAAEARRVALDVSLDALNAFYTLAERKAVARILDEQGTLLDQTVAIAQAHYASGQILQSDVYRLENEAARLRSDRRATTAEIRGAEAMLNVALGRRPDAALPALAEGGQTAEPPALSALLGDASRVDPSCTVSRRSVRGASRRSMCDEPSTFRRPSCRPVRRTLMTLALASRQRSACASRFGERSCAQASTKQEPGPLPHRPISRPPA